MKKGYIVTGFIVVFFFALGISYAAEKLKSSYSPVVLKESFDTVKERM
jgi:hypothetical protein